MPQERRAREYGSHEYRLRDGTRVQVRPIRPEDKEELQEGLHRLSSASVYRRFGRYVKGFSKDQLAYLTEIDHVDHMALVVINPVHGHGIAVGRYIRVKEEPEVAEIALTVLDEYQNRGLGRLLLKLLSDHARSNGIGSFRAHVLTGNAPMLHILHDVGAETEGDEMGELRLKVPVSMGAPTWHETLTGKTAKAMATFRGKRRSLPASEEADPDDKKEGKA